MCILRARRNMLEAGEAEGCANSCNPKHAQYLLVERAWGYPELSFRHPSCPHLQQTHVWLGSTLAVLLLASSTLVTGPFPHERSDQFCYLCGNCMCCTVLISLGLVFFHYIGIIVLPYLKIYHRSHGSNYCSNEG